LGIAWNGEQWLAGGTGTNTLAYSYDGINWTAVTSSPFNNTCNDIAWNGNYWIAVGSILNTIAYSPDGINWTGLGTSALSNGLGVAWNRGLPGVFIQQPAIACGGNSNSPSTTINTLSFSPDGIRWYGLGKSVFTSEARNAVWNGNIWVGLGSGTNTLAYSKDGINWTGLGTSIFTSIGTSAAWNGSLWVAVGGGTNSIAYSNDGINWTAVTLSPFGTGTGNDVAWNGKLWVATGAPSPGNEPIATSTNGITWTPVVGTSTLFSSSGESVAWGGDKWVAVGRATNTIAWSPDGTTWTGLGLSTFNFCGYGVTWNGIIWVAVGQQTTTGTSNIAYSTDGITWTLVSTNFFDSYGHGVCWNGVRFIAVGADLLGTTGSTVKYSRDGIDWYDSPDNPNIFNQVGWGVNSNSTVGIPVNDSQIVLNPGGFRLSNNLDVVSEEYYNGGYTNFSASFKSHLLN
jgi:hypothetical protein